MDKTLTYDQLLTLTEWKEKRETILKRDKLICRHCQNSSYEAPSRYGPYVYIQAPLMYVTLACFDGAQERIYTKDEHGTGLIKTHVMLHMIRHRSNGVDDTVKEGYYPAAARELTTDEIKYYLPFTNSSLSAEERLEAIKQFVHLSFREDSTQTGLIERKDLIGIPRSEYIWTFVKDLHVHHTYYQLDKLPWEYPDDSLVTLCRSCHEKVHETKEIPVLDSQQRKVGNYAPCYRCKGAGWFPEYRHIQKGICFACRGKRYLDQQFIKKV